ncbi:MAG: polyprenol monophosphomannose synthase [Actinomycetota bacterium]
MKVLVVVPTYNEAGTIQSLLTRVLACHPDLHILVVDDSSPDGTGKLVDEFGEAGRVELMTRGGKQGLGRAYVAGFCRGLGSGYDLLVEIDADLSHNPADLPRLIEATKHADLVIGSRYVPGGDVSGWSAGRKMLSRCANFYARNLLGLAIRDVTAGFRCYRRELLEAIDLESITTNGYAFQVEMSYRAARGGFRITELPIVFKERELGSSKMSRQIAAEGLFWVARRAMRDWFAR